MEKRTLFITKYLAIPLFLLSFVAIVKCSSQSGQAHGEVDLQQDSDTENADYSHFDTATLAGGCFWCMEAVYERIKGVEEVISGYAGGTEKNPTYEQVGRGSTHHAESIQIYYDPSVISFNKLLEVFFLAAHDPTQVNGQGPDIGPQYRSIAFYTNTSEKEAIEAAIKKFQPKFDKPIATEVTPLDKFYKAEAYHQDFEERNPNQSYIVAVSRPKINKFIEKFPELLKDEYR